MFRYLVAPVLMALLLVPDWASALGRRRPIFAQRAQPVATAYPVQYAQPVYYPATPVQSYPVAQAPGCSPCCPATASVAPAKPTVIPERMEPAPAPKPKSNVQSEPLAQPKAIEPEPSFKPASGTETLPAMKDPIPVVPVPPVAKPKEPEIIPIIPTAKPKEIELPALPPLKLDAEPKKIEELPKLDLPKLDLPSIPPLIVPNPTPSSGSQGRSQSSPLNAEPAKLKIDRYPLDGAAPASPDSLRLVTFYNFSAAELTLTLAGKAVIVPGKHSVEARLPAKFDWKIGDAAQPEGDIPMTAPGLVVVIGK